MIRNFIIPSKQNNYSPIFSTRVAMVIITLWVLMVNIFSGVLLGNLGVHATSITADRIIALTNQERASRGLGTLKSNAYLASAAHAKANNMFALQYWDHFGPNGESPWQFIVAAGYQYMYAGENLGKGFSTSEGVHQAWMASPTHRDNILSSHYEDIGIAIVSGVLHGTNTILVVQMFGSTLKNTPPAPVVPEPVVQEKNVVIGGEEKKVRYIQGDSEDKKIKSIRIVYPEQDMTYTDPQVHIKGESANFNAGTTVEIITNNDTLGQANIEQDGTWGFKNLFDWQEGRNNVDAVISDASGKYRDSVSFIISSVPPKILEINVSENDENFIIKIKVDEKATNVSLVLGDKIVEGDLIEGLVEFITPREDIKNKVFLVASDEHGNITQEDITSYFPKQESNARIPIGGFLNFSIPSIQKTITVLLATIILAILLIQLYFYREAGRLKEQSGDFLMVGVWWFIFLFGSFIGYSGTIY